MASGDQLLRSFCLVGEEHILRFHSGHDIGASLHHLSMNALTFDHLAHLDEVSYRGLKTD
jgi:hypothetical protein